MAHTDPKEVEIIQTRKTGLGLANPMLLHIGNEARVKLRQWAENEGVSVNAVVVSMLEEFFKQLPQKSVSPEMSSGRRSGKVEFWPGNSGMTLDASFDVPASSWTASGSQNSCVLAEARIDAALVQP